MIHDDHPFRPPVEERDPVRRFRGRLVAPVTVVTSGGPGEWAGLTVSSLLVAEGEPARLFFLVGPDTDLWDAIERTGRFVVHILDAPHRRLGDRFAGLAPSPGGPFAGLEVVDGDHGPVLVWLGNRAACTLEGTTGTTHHLLVTGVVDEVVVDDLHGFLAYFRGSYRVPAPGE